MRNVGKNRDNGYRHPEATHSFFLRFGGLMPLFFLPYWLSFHTYNTFTHSYPWTFAEAPLHSLIADQLSGSHLPEVPSRASNSGPPYSEPSATNWATPHPEPPLILIFAIQWINTVLKKWTRRRLKIDWFIATTITQICSCAGWQISPRNLPEFSARHGIVYKVPITYS